MTLPEMVFGDTKLEIKNEEEGLEFSFTAYEALDACAREVDVEVTDCPFLSMCRHFYWLIGKLSSSNAEAS